MFYILANLGGTLGVCIGGSILTIIEFLEFAILQVTHALCGCSKKPKKSASKDLSTKESTCLSDDV